ncbi:MAG: tRNA lysidine(34) synthetase TilS [Syntrophomonas sp.]|nr:tRNA lysidine(34) synthetase TilS [Syntrophomonas sp.]
MLRKVRKYIQEEKLLEPGKKVLLGVSGGPDSMALLHIMHKLTPEMDLSLVALHLNHGLRPEAAAEEEFVREHCRKWAIDFYSRQADIRSLAAQQKKSLEEAGRDCRYQYFFEFLEELPADYIATAHHQDDQTETVLLHLLRGSGLKGLRGIMPRKGQLLRPLLALSKAEIVHYLDENQIPYCLDQSNKDLSFLRNRIRCELIPYLQKAYNPRIIESLNQLAGIARDENDYLEKQLHFSWDKLLRQQEPDLIILDKKALGEEHPALQKRLVLEALARLRGESGWEVKDVQRILRLLYQPGSSKYIQLRKGLRVKSIYQELHFRSKETPAAKFCYPISIPDRLSISETGENYIIELGQLSDMQAGLSSCLDYDKLEQPLFLRSRQPGDRFQPSGMKGSKKVKDYFIDIKLPREQRDRVPLLASGQSIYAVVGYRVSSLAELKAETRRVLIVRKENT